MAAFGKNKAKAEFKKKEKGLTGGKRLAVKIVTVAVSVIALFLTFTYLTSADRAARNTVAIARVKSSVPAFAVLGKGDVESYDLIRKEYDDKNMILFENAEDEVYGKYAAYYIREKTPLYKDQLTEEKPIRNEWLYSLSAEEEVVTIPYKYSEAGGDILLPGDTIRIRVSYEAEEVSTNGNSDEDYNPNAYYGTSSKKVIKTELLFDTVVVKDMINSSGHSVYEVYKEVMRLSEKDRETAMKSKDFISSIKPVSLLLAGSAEDMEQYASFKSRVGSGDFLITILSRADNSVGLDSLPTLETEVRSWIDGMN